MIYKSEHFITNEKWIRNARFLLSNKIKIEKNLYVHIYIYVYLWTISSCSSFHDSNQLRRPRVIPGERKNCAMS